MAIKERSVLIPLMKCYSYVITRDFGFAPNPFYGLCTLATCKQDIRKSASIGDWIIGCGSSKYKLSGYLIYVMQVNKKVSFDEYWNDARYQCKRPVMNGSLKQLFGDNIYHSDAKTQKWIQENSHHSLADGKENLLNKERDLRSKSVLISENYWFFGRDAIKFPIAFTRGDNCLCHKYIGYSINKTQKTIGKFIEWLKHNKQNGYHADPYLFKEFARYKGN